MIAQDKLERFLALVPPAPRPVKGDDIDRLIDRIKAASNGAPYWPKGNPPWPHQLEGLAFTLEQRKALLFIKVRRGKTKIALDWMTQLYKGGLISKKVLVIVPQPIILTTWQIEVAAHSDLTVAIAVDRGGIDAALSSDAQIVVVSWGTLISFAKGGKMQGDIKLGALEVLASHFHAGVIDETHTCKNHKTVRWNIANILFGRFNYRLGLTGTPFGRNPFDLWAQAYLMDKGNALAWHHQFFVEAFGVSEPVTDKDKIWSKKRKKLIDTPHRWIFDKTKSDLLMDKMAGIAISYGWEDAEALPEIVKGSVRIPIYGEQREMYQGEIDKVIDRVKSLDQGERENVFVHLREISSGFLKFQDEGEDHIVRSKENSKIDWLETFLAELGDCQVVIVHEFIESGNMLCECLERLIHCKADPLKLRYGHIKGGVGAKASGKMMLAFQAHELDVLIINHRSVSMGVDLSAADYFLFYESPVSPIQRIQVEARATANRQGRTLFVDDMLCSPVEYRIIGFIKEGKSLLANLVYIDDVLEGV